MESIMSIMIKGKRHASTTDEWLIEVKGSDVNAQVRHYILALFVAMGERKAEHTIVYSHLLLSLSQICNIDIDEDLFKKIVKEKLLEEAADDTLMVAEIEEHIDRTMTELFGTYIAATLGKL